MVFRVEALMPCGAFHVPGLREPVTGYHVRAALENLHPRERCLVEAYLANEGRGSLPPPSALAALRQAVLETVHNGQPAASRGKRPAV